MRTVLLLLGLGTLSVFLGWNAAKLDAEPDPAPSPVKWSADMQTIADGHNRFAIELYAKLRENEKGNVFLSPYSVHTALAMTATGAKGNTRDQMVKVLHLPTAGNKILASGDIGRYYAHPRKDFELSVANALWGQKGFPWRPEWLGVLKERFGGGFNEADFAANPDDERQRINKWVEEKTRDRIKELLLPPQVAKPTTMVLANAIYFKGNWATQFDKKKTANAPFKCDDKTTVNVPMMHASMKCRLGNVNGVTMAELPYRGGELAMLIVLPKTSEKLADLEKTLTPELFTKWRADLQNRDDVSVSIPKFKIEARYGLPGYLESLGMTDAFKAGVADFTGMASESPGRISQIVHKAFVDVNEEGTEAAAATAVVLADPGKPISFKADRPFLFFICDTKHDTILFLGRVEKP